MMTPRNIRISQKITLLIAGLACGFVAIGIAYFAQMSIEKDIRQQRAFVSDTERLLDAIRFDLLDLNKLLLEYVVLEQQDAVGKQSVVRDALNDKLEILTARSEEVGVTSELENIQGLLNEFDSRYQNIVNQHQLLGENAKDGLLLELATTADKFEAVLLEVDTPEIKSIVLDLRKEEKDFIAVPTSEALAIIEGKIYDLIPLLTEATLRSQQSGFVMSVLGEYSSKLGQLVVVAEEIETYEQDLTGIGEKLIAVMSVVKVNAQKYAVEIGAEVESKSQMAMAVFIGLSFLIVMVVSVGVFFIYKSIVIPMAHFQRVIGRINRGNLKARVRIYQSDELGDLGNAFNELLDERIQNLEEQAVENEVLNDSIISLTQAVGSIADQKDLTVNIPVSADVTGTISDAVNLLTSETAKTLAKVSDISQHVNTISDDLQAQTGVIVRIADDEHKQIIATSKALELSAKAMNEIAARAETADTIAGKTISDAKEAQEAVTQTVNGILTIRETMSETEKRIKRLGDRSQEISGIVSLINTIAERTHILALNASMQAASAGEAGKGFAVVADEVQRLAENAREATAEIASMVNNIRVETSDTVNIMNRLISEVVAGTKLAEHAGKRMEITEDATRQLVETVQVISHSSTQQAKLVNKIRDRSNMIRKCTEKTAHELHAQQQHTDTLKHHADVLLEHVNIFNLPKTLPVPDLIAQLDTPHSVDVHSEEMEVEVV